MDLGSINWKLVREVVGVILMVSSAVLAVSFLVSVAGVGATVVTAVLLGLAALGRRLASGTVTETEGGTERDYEPEGDGPLYVDPDDPQAFIPRQ